MSERKVLTKYYPPDFDPSQIKRTRGPKASGPKVQPVRLMAPFSMKCTTCGEYIHKGRKFNARKEIPPNDQYLNIQIYRFYIRCTRCSAEITFKTDPKNMDYACERGAQRNTEAWRKHDQPDESIEERLDRLEREEAGEAEDRDAMHDLEVKAMDSKLEEEVGDALDAIRVRNAKRERSEQTGLTKDEQVVNQDEEDAADEAAAKQAFQKKRRLSDQLTQVSVTDSPKKTDDALWSGAKKSRKRPHPRLLPGLVKKS